VFARAWQLLTLNWQIVVPGLIVGALGAFVSTLLAPPPTASDLVRSIGNVTLGALQIIVSIVSIAYTTGMAQAAWIRGKATYDDGFRAIARDGPNIFVAMVGMFVVGLFALVTAPFTVGLTLGLYVFFFIFTMPGAVVGERPGLLAMRDSCMIAFKRPIPTVLMVLALAAIIATMGVFASLLTVAPLVGPLVAAVVVQAVIAYLSLVTVGEYLALRRVLHT
jgi:hypothetical protein